MSTVLQRKKGTKSGIFVEGFIEENPVLYAKFLSLSLTQEPEEAMEGVVDATGSKGDFIRLAYGTHEGQDFEAGEWLENDEEMLLVVDINTLFTGGGGGLCYDLRVQVSQDGDNVWHERVARLYGVPINVPVEDGEFGLELTPLLPRSGLSIWSVTDVCSFAPECLDADTGVLTFEDIDAVGEHGGVVYRVSGVNLDVESVVLLGRYDADVVLRSYDPNTQVMLGVFDWKKPAKWAFKYRLEEEDEWILANGGVHLGIGDNGDVEDFFDGNEVTPANGGYLALAVEATGMLPPSEAIDIKRIGKPVVVVEEVVGGVELALGMEIEDTGHAGYLGTNLVVRFKIIGGTFAGNYSFPEMGVGDEPDASGLSAPLQALIETGAGMVKFLEDLWLEEGLTEITFTIAGYGSYTDSVVIPFVQVFDGYVVGGVV